MRTRRSMLILCALFAAGTLTLQAADVSGTWTAQVPGRDGQTREVTYTFKVDGEKLTGAMTTPMGEAALTDGQIKGDTLSFTVAINTPNGEIKMLHKGTVKGDEIAFTRQREGGDRVQEFVAKRAK